MRWSWSAYALLTAPAVLWSTGLFAASIAHSSGWDGLAFATRLLYSPVCHQDAARSFVIAGWPMNVCHRCSGIYLSFTVMLLILPWFRARWLRHSVSVRRLAIFVLPLLLDYALDVLGVWRNSAMSRLLSGVVAGAGLALFVLPAWMEVWTSRRHRGIHHSEEASR
ncbi:MAG: DUF2085 domain-containing protein [Bacteroidota bacterium]|nr:DUF2085 domain-containing protein [Bacteroidota bacterium]